MSVDSIGGLGSSDIATLFGTPLNSGGTATFAASDLVADGQMTELGRAWLEQGTDNGNDYSN